MSGGRTIWWQKDCGWWRREWIVELGEEFGAAGPAVIDWLSCEAKLQNDGGRVSSGVKAIARGCFVDAVTVGHVLSRSVTLSLLEDYEDRDGRFSCRLSGWKADNERGSAAERQRQRRGRESPPNGSVEPNPPDEHSVTERDMSRSVTECHGESLKRRVEESREVESQSPSGLDSLRDRTDLAGLSERMAAKVLENDPKARVAPGSKAWLDPLRLLVDLDGRTVEEVARVIDFCAGDDFERSNVLCPSKLRKRFDELALKAEKAPAPRATFGRGRPSPVEGVPCPSGAHLLTDLWAPIEQRLRDALGDGYEVGLGTLHLHGIDKERAVVGCAPQQASWVRARYPGVLEAAAGVPVEIVGCMGLQEVAA